MQTSAAADGVEHANAAAVPASPIPTLHASNNERPVYASRFEPLNDVNPVVRPESHPVRSVVEEAAHTSPSAPPVVEAAVIAVAPPVVEAAASAVAPPLLVAETTASLIAPPVVEAATSASPFEPAHAEARSAEAPTIDTAAHAAAVVHESVVNEPVVHESVTEAPVQASAFETAPTEFAVSETPIVHSELAELALVATPSVDEASANETLTAAEGPVAERAEAEPAPVVTASSAGAESVVSEAEIHEQLGRQTLPYPGPPRSFTSSGSEMPVVITTPAPYRRDSRAPASNLFGLGRELLPRAQAWSKKTLRENPRALVIAAPLVALLGIWGVRSAFSHPKHAEGAAANSDLAAQTTQTSVAPAASVASPAAILVSNSSAAAAAPPSADPAELTHAVAHGLPALEALAQKYPNDPQVGIALASQQAQAQRFEAAVGSLEHVIQVDAKSAQNGKVMGILWRAAQSDASEQSFLALRKLGARGADIAFDLATTSGVRDSVRERAKSELQTSLSTEASGDTRVAAALLLASDCKARKSLLARAEREGGKRTRALLEQYSRGSTCTSSTDKACNTCLTGSAALTHALAQLNAGGQK